MPRMSVEKRSLALMRLERGDSLREVAGQIGVSAPAVLKLKRKVQLTGRLEDFPRGAPPKKTTKHEDRAIVRAVIKNPSLCAKSIAERSTVSREKVRRRLQGAGLIARRATQKPFVSPANRKKRIQFAQETIGKDLHLTVSTDESKFNRFNNDGKHWVWHLPGQHLSPGATGKTLQGGGGSILVWGCLTSLGVGPLVRLDGAMNSQRYEDLLEEALLPWARARLPETWEMVQDNAPCHKARRVMQFLHDQQVRVVDWPPQSRDLNVIENLWTSYTGRTQKGVRWRLFRPLFGPHFGHTIGIYYDGMGAKRGRQFVKQLSESDIDQLHKAGKALLSLAYYLFE